MLGWTDGWRNECLDGPMDGGMDILSDRWMDKETTEWVEREE